MNCTPTPGEAGGKKGMQKIDENSPLDGAHGLKMFYEEDPGNFKGGWPLITAPLPLYELALDTVEGC